jgi:cholesterol oxidase
VIVAAGCLGTTELLLKCREKRESLPNLSATLGHGFSTNGDYIAFLEKTQNWVSLARGPVTTSFAHFNEHKDDGGRETKHRFHTLEDQGIPPALASLTGAGLPVIRSLSRNRGRGLFIIWALLCWLWARSKDVLRGLFSNHLRRHEMFKNQEEHTGRMICVVGMGREAAKGVFTLGKDLGDTPLRVRRSDGLGFDEDPVYNDIRDSLAKLAVLIRDKDATHNGQPIEFFNPFLEEEPFKTFRAGSIALTHPLGGCRMGATPDDGVVDEFGRVFNYPGLYVADGSMIPTALGVNPSLTISALTLRIVAEAVIPELDAS